MLELAEGQLPDGKRLVSAANLLERGANVIVLVLLLSLLANVQPVPPAAVMPNEKPSASHMLRKPGAGPTSGLPSGV